MTFTQTLTTIIAIAASIAFLALVFAPEKNVQADAEYYPIEIYYNSPSPTATVAPTELPAPTVTPFRKLDVPLGEPLQKYISDLCKEYHISFPLVIAIIRQESNFKVNAIGDNGNSVGLMQIQARFHGELMDRLGVDNLMNARQNIKVGVALLAEYFAEGPDIEFVLMRYNGGLRYAFEMAENGIVSDYAKEVIENERKYSEEVENENRIIQ